MSPTVHHECIRVPVTALAAIGPLLLAAEGPLVRFYVSPEARQFNYLASRRIFATHAIHGVAVYELNPDHVVFAFWGGPFVRFLELIDLGSCINVSPSYLDRVQLSPVTKASDWILDLQFSPSGTAGEDLVTCAAVTAHNALVRFRYRLVAESGHRCSKQSQESPLFSELTSSSRSILYSAHISWFSPDHVVVAAGTAFGEIIYWSWRRATQGNSSSSVHRVFSGHEGSIFGVRISGELRRANKNLGRYLASCSDDRTIRIWDLSDIATHAESTERHSEDQRIRHTGFSNDLVDAETSRTPCKAMGWGHLSRVWAAHFLESPIGISLLSSGEDATTRLWRLTDTSEVKLSSSGSAPLTLDLKSTAAYHSGKNIWSTVVMHDKSQVVCGAADSKITTYTLADLEPRTEQQGYGPMEYTLRDIISLSQLASTPPAVGQPIQRPKNSKADDFYRSYAFLDSNTFLLTTNSGKVFIETLAASANGSGPGSIVGSELVHEIDEGSGNSVCATEICLGVGFVAGARGGIYMYQRGTLELRKIHTVRGKVGSLFTSRSHSGKIILLITVMGQKAAQLLYIASPGSTNSNDASVVHLAILESETGTTITSMEHLSASSSGDSIVLGFRGGTVAVYALPQDSTKEDAEVKPDLIERAHGKEAVTSLLWHPSDSTPAEGHLVSVGRDGCCAIHHIDLVARRMTLHHYLPLPVGPNIEGIYEHHGHLIMYGFSSTKFIVYDITVEEEIMSVETGGSHRSWSFHPYTMQEGGGTLVWTRASTMHVHTQHGPNHRVIRSGGHGREIKSVAVSNGVGDDKSRQLIATGAEDTDIKIFEYMDGDLECQRTLRKHKTGIQHLQWSDNGDYLFSSGGCEEFYIWRVRVLPSFIGTGIRCEAVCKPESEHSDLRIMSFNVRKCDDGKGLRIALVYSNSNIRIYTYIPSSLSEPQRWRTLAQGTYFTSCLTQCVFLSSQTILTAGTDGHAVLWPLHIPTSTDSASAETVKWHHPARIHQSTSKTLETCTLPNNSTLIVSGGDDGSLSFLLTSPDGNVHMCSPITVVRTHASAVTACAIVLNGEKVYVLTSGNDQWIRVWEVVVYGQGDKDAGADPLAVKRAGKVKSNVADVSSMAVLGTTEATTVLLCGVGMEVVRVEW
ncbi:WD40 repeat-like protein [Sporormia fimetaria CBS 119925]|uniref:WD40 repeat-like protein n=1 Tax=Sporormia fimetaria CBS 119925 TaxID=1340428 RepID=A0A6A6VMZ9_9PLEO|nr:WD40 repeat-like protein [Sporormia fimetaria CBS 119925]